MNQDTLLPPLVEELARELNDQFVRQFGPILSSEALLKVLGYKSSAAYRQAVVRDTVPVPLFQNPNRRGRFALNRPGFELTPRSWTNFPGRFIIASHEHV